MKYYEHYWLIAGLFFGIAYGVLIGSIAFINFEITKNIAELSAAICDLLTIIIGSSGLYVAIHWKKQLLTSKKLDHAIEIRQNLNFFIMSFKNFSSSIDMYIDRNLNDVITNKLNIQANATLEAWNNLHKSLIKYLNQENIEEFNNLSSYILLATKFQRNTYDDFENIKVWNKIIIEYDLKSKIDGYFPEKIY
ncbi:MAG: hypothetical protein H7A09_04050 [Oceanospirillaceae bacterium]|nr:hypothetical protein [Oceanospirillaceae bacterium]MCP5335241.1 hypothetical protein [Oceanospirillaceae bacterium]